jgi:hypothetical protein
VKKPALHHLSHRVAVWFNSPLSDIVSSKLRLWGQFAFSDGRLRRWNAGWQRVVGAILSFRWVNVKKEIPIL